MLNVGERIGDWIVVRPLGEGGMGAVYEARNAMSDRIRAALKVMKPESLDDAKSRFIREVETLHALRHPAIVRVAGWGEDANRGLLFLAMEMVAGEELGKRIAAGPMDPETARRTFEALAQALAHAHASGIAHRDLKPANILLTESGEPRLVDFGIAVQEGRTRLTGMGMVAGTPAYMAPELFVGEHIDAKVADVYSLGQVLYECLVGAEAFPDKPGLSSHQQLVHLIGRKSQATSLDPGAAIPAPLRSAVLAATHPDPQRRPTMEALAAALSPTGSVNPPTTWVNTTPQAPSPAPVAPPVLVGPQVPAAPSPVGPANTRLKTAGVAVGLLSAVGITAVVATLVVIVGVVAYSASGEGPAASVGAVEPIPAIVEPDPVVPDDLVEPVKAATSSASGGSPKPARAPSPSSAVAAPSTPPPSVPVVAAELEGEAVPPRLTEGGVTVQGAMTDAELRAGLEPVGTGMAECSRHVTTAPGPGGGEVVLKFTIGRDGHVASSKVKSTTLNNAAFEQCLEANIVKAVFSPPKGGGIVVVTFPVTLGPASAAAAAPSASPPVAARLGKLFVAFDGLDGETLLVDGVAQGTLPASIDVTEGTHTFEVAGKRKVVRDVVFNAAGRAALSE